MIDDISERVVGWKRSSCPTFIKEHLSDVQRGTITGAIVGAVFIVLLIILLWVFSGIFTSLRGSRINLFTALTNILLTAGLLGIYYSIAHSERNQVKLQNELQKFEETQTEIQQTQTDILGAEFEPVIEVLNFNTDFDTADSDKFSSVSVTEDDGNVGDWIELGVSNYTEAIATNLRLRFVIDYVGTKIVGHAYVPISKRNNETSWTKKEGSILQGKEAIWFRGVAGLSFMPARGRTNSLSYCLSGLLDELDDESLIRVGFSLTYEDRKGDEHRVDIEGYEFTPSDIPDSKSPTLHIIQEYGEEVPVAKIRDLYLRRGIPEPPYEY